MGVKVKVKDLDTKVLIVYHEMDMECVMSYVQDCLIKYGAVTLGDIVHERNLNELIPKEDVMYYYITDNDGIKYVKEHIQIEFMKDIWPIWKIIFNKRPELKNY